jgi:uncharacterized protein YcnI
MRFSAWSSLAISVYSSLALVCATAALAHVVANPTFVPSGSSQAIMFSGPNERQKPMTSFVVIAPTGLEIEHAHPVSGWTEESTTTAATWTGGSLSPREDIPFRLTLKATATPGTLDMKAEQRYADGGIVSWPVPITVVPAEESPSQNLALAGVVGLIGVLIVVALAAVAWRRRPVPAQPGDDQ